MARGTLRIYLGAAPGVGKTYAMLDEGWRRHNRGTDVVIALVIPHERKNTIDQIRDLEIVPPRRIGYRGAEFTEMDVDAVLARRPAVCLVDEYAHTNVPGSWHEKRWQDVETILDAGIDVISTLNVQHLESLNDLITRITGVVQRETVPDSVVRRADQLELVDMSPEALRRRMAHGNIYPPERVDAALSNYFRVGNLGALRELALLWVADRVEESLHDYLDAHGIDAAWETRERVVVAVTGHAADESLIRRAARIAGRARGDLLGVHVEAGDGLAERAGPDLEKHRRLISELGGTYHEVVGDKVAVALIRFAEAEKATQLVLGESRHKQRRWLPRSSVTAGVLRQASGIDVHVIARAGSKPAAGASVRRPMRHRTAVSPRRQQVAWLLAVVGLPLLSYGLSRFRDDLDLSTVLLVFLAVVVGIGAIGGILPGLAGAVVGFLLANRYFVPPLHTFAISATENLTALVVFVTVAVTVSTVVDRSARRSREALRARAEAEALARATGSLVGDHDPLPVVLEQLRSTFSADCAAVVTGEPFTVKAAVGGPWPTSLADGVAVPLDTHERTTLVLTGHGIEAEDQRVLRAFADQLSLALESRRLRTEAVAAAEAAQASALRAAILQSVSHDLRTPLSSIKASVSSLLQHDVEWTDKDRAEFLATIDAEADRLNRVVGNLLDMSRLQSGAVQTSLRSVGLEEVVGATLASLSGLADVVVVDVPETLPLVCVDPALLERALANVVSNAIAWSPAGEKVRVEAAEVVGRLHVRVIDRGPGIPLSQRERVFEPFQRLGDRSNDTGAGLGLAIAKGFVEVLGGTITLDDTPGGGLTVTIELPIEGAAS
ncbi:MAG: ATP-binding protein [Acidimicrobiales bacterium]